MQLAQPIDWDLIREEQLQKQYEEDLTRLKTAYARAQAAGDQDKMSALASAMDEL